jgi:hypothetical protein
MPLQWKPQDIEVYLNWIKCIAEQEVELNDWEGKFVLSLHQRLIHGANLTEAQATRLEEIYAGKTK